MPTLLLLLAVCIGVLVTLPRGAIENVPVVVTAPVQAATPPANDIAALRTQFESFLAERAARLPPLSMAQKDALFDEFLAHHRRE